MKVLYTKKFLKHLTAIPSKQRQEIENFVFEVFSKTLTIGELDKFEKLKGYSNCYKARFGSYRIGIVVDKNTIEPKRVIDRKNIYKFFP